MKKVLFLLCVPLISLVACKSRGDAEAAAADNEKPQYTLTPFSQSQAYDDARLESVTLENGTFTAAISGTSYQLGVQTPDANQKFCANSAEGQHLHVIIDDQPYLAKYDSSFALEIPDGDHYLLTFLSRSYHESIKTPDAYQASRVTVAGNSITASEPIQGPMLFYSRPKGLYSGQDAEKVMLDFYLVNTDLSGYQIEADINGEKHVLTSWQPYYIEGLPEGDNTITLTLQDASGQPVALPLNPVSRTFQIEKTPAAN